MSTTLQPETDYIELNARLNVLGPNGEYQLDQDTEAVRQYFLTNINQNTVFFHNLKEKLDTFVDTGKYEAEFLALYSHEFIKSLFKFVYGKKFRFKSYMGALKFYTGYAMKTDDNSRYLERYEDRVATTALYLAQGEEELAMEYARVMIDQVYQPATPTYLNSGKKQRGELVSCFLLRMEDSMNSISEGFRNALQLSKRGGGVAFLLTNIRETGAPIKGMHGRARGAIPIMKIFEDCFSYADQLGARQGAGAVWVNCHHMDLMSILDTKRENADEKIRIKSLSVGVILTDCFWRALRDGKDYYQFSTYDIKKVYGIPMSDIDINARYQELVNNPKIGKKRINAEEVMQTLTALEGESGYPYIMNDTPANEGNPLKNLGRINMSNLCVSGSQRLLTSRGYVTAKELYETQEDIKVNVDLRARDMNKDSYGISTEESTKMFKTAENAPVYEIELENGMTLRSTDWHKYYVIRDGQLIKIPLNEVGYQDHLLLQSGEGSFGNTHQPQLAALAGALMADGTIAQNESGTSFTARFDLYGQKAEKADFYEECAALVLKDREDLVERQSTTEPKFTTNEVKSFMSSAPIFKLFKEHGWDLTGGNGTKLDTIPAFVQTGDRETQRSFISSVFSLDGCITKKSDGSCSIELGSVNKDFLKEIQLMLINMGIETRIYRGRKSGRTMLPDGKGSYKTYEVKQMYSLRPRAQSKGALFAEVDWLQYHKDLWMGSDELNKTEYKMRSAFTSRVHDIKFIDFEDVYDVTVENGNSVIFEGIATGNCSEILQVNAPSNMAENGTYETIGLDISCNLGSMNVYNVMKSPNPAQDVTTAIRMLTAVSDMSRVDCSPSILRANQEIRSVGLGQMNLASAFGAFEIMYGSPASVEFADMYFSLINFYSLRASVDLSMERGIGHGFIGWEESEYGTGEYFDKMEKNRPVLRDSKVKRIFEQSNWVIPTDEDYQRLREDCMKFGPYNGYRQAIAPTGSISYVNNSSSSLHPSAARIEARKEGKTGRVYYPAPLMTNENAQFFEDAYAVSPYRMIDVYAAATKHTDQGLSCTLFVGAETSTGELAKIHAYARSKGIKTTYYVRVRQKLIEGTEDEGCVSCAV